MHKSQSKKFHIFSPEKKKKRKRKFHVIRFFGQSDVKKSQKKKITITNSNSSYNHQLWKS